MVVTQCFLALLLLVVAVVVVFGVQMVPQLEDQAVLAVAAQTIT
jgi:hypothetical protein